MDYSIREMRPDETHLLDDFLYEAIYIPEGYAEEIPRSVIYEDKKMHAAIKDFGMLADDACFVAVADGKVIGAVWVGIRDTYGHMDNETPSFSISLLKEYRGRGIGTALMETMLERLRAEGYRRASLGVSKGNYAVRMYEKVGFAIVGDGENETEWLMVCNFEENQ